ncbi:1-phosphofructokinase family hexose kinase [Actinomadura rupiterrae]|uniref:1-phosphofructokinase family hexose kinase n=1 Tax=Actinomadura rupiterrae TaxID=559627 RepID=UPI0020A394B8|nr:PfkB family carbohydrate kinase [Actinomadura rupiterrae]MCP2336927.1 tagatose 6-phosphate kinase [Actinomadura rupiterrae]
MILTVTLNAALDVTYEVGALEQGGSHRVRTVRERAGGKGINVARVAGALGCEVVATGLLGGVVGDLIRDDLDAAGLAHDFLPISGPSRRTLTIVETETGEATVLNEAGPQVRPEEWRAFLDHFRALAESASVVVLSGSLPPGLPADAYAELVRLAPGKVVLDADGGALTRGVAGRPDVIKPNAEELLRATAGAGTDVQPGHPDVGGGRDIAKPSEDEPASTRGSLSADQPEGASGGGPEGLSVRGASRGAQSGGEGGVAPAGGAVAGGEPEGGSAGGAGSEGDSMRGAVSGGVLGGGLAGREWFGEVVGRADSLRASGAGAVLVSLGADGMLAVTADGVWRAVPPRAVAGNPTGAGDAAVAATARALLLGRPWDALLRDAVALSAAAVAAPVAGDFDPDLYVRLLPEIMIEGLPCPS